MDIDFYSDNHFNIKDIKDIFKRLNKDKKISRSVIEYAYSYNKEQTQDITDGMLTIFDKVDSKGKIKDEIEIGELAEFLDNVVKAAGDDMDLSKEEAETIIGKISENSEAKPVTSEHLFNFLRVLQVNMEGPLYNNDAVIMDEIIVTPNGSTYRDSIYQKGQVVSINKNEFGMVDTWIDLAKRLYKEDGFDESDYTSVEWNNRANELRNMNGNKALKDLDRVNVKMSNHALLNNKEKLLNSFEMYMDNMAVPLAEKISRIVANAQTTDSIGQIKELFDNNEINSENIVPLFNMYMSDKNILNGDTSLLDAIMSETAFFITTRTEVRQMQRALMDRIVELLNKAAEDAGVRPDVIAQFSSSLSGQLANIFVWENLETLTSKWDDGMKKEKFEGTVKSYIATIISAKRVKEVDNPLEHADKAIGDNKVIMDNLSEMYKNYDEDQGWFSNFVDGVTGLFGARTRGDIEKLLKGSKEDLDELETAIKAKNYKKFKQAYLKCFGMPFDPRVIQAQNEVGTKLALINMSDNLQLALYQKTKQDMLKYIDDSMKKVIDEQCQATYGKSINACSETELKSVLQSFSDTYSKISEGILKVTPKSKLESDYERLTAASPMLIVQNQVESYMNNQSTCVACAEIVGDIVATALIPGGSLMLLGKLGKWGYKAKNVINIACKVMDSNGKLAVARNVLKTGGIVYANHRLTYGQSSLESLKAAGEMSLFGLVGFGNSTLARLLINSSKFPSIAKYGQEAASMLGDAAFMELFNKVSGSDTNLEQDLTQFLAIYILGKLMHSAVNGDKNFTKDEKELMNKIAKELGLPEDVSQIKTSHLLTYAKKNIKDSKLVKSIEKFLKSNNKKPGLQDLPHGNNQVDVSFDTGLIKGLAKKISAQKKYILLNRKINKLNDLLNFYGIKEEPLKSLSETETNKLIENLEIFETATENITPEQRTQFGKLFKDNPNITKDLSTLDARAITRKLKVKNIDNGRNIAKSIDEKVISDNFDNMLKDIVGIESEHERNLLTKFMLEASSRIDSDAQIDITNAQLEFIRQQGATSENTFMLAPQPNTVNKLKSYTNAARDIVEISNTEGSSLQLKADNTRTEIKGSMLFGPDETGTKFIIVSDDCSMSGASILEDSLTKLGLGTNLKTGQNVNVIFAPTVLGPNAVELINRFSNLYNRITNTEIKDLKVRLDQAAKKKTEPNLEGLSQNALDLYNMVKFEIADGHTDGDHTRTIITNLSNSKNNKGGNLSFSLANVSDNCPMQMAKSYFETDAYRNLSPEDKQTVDFYMTARGQSFGYRNNSAIAIIEGYESQGYDFIGNTTERDAKKALGIDENNQTRQNLPVKGNAPNNNVVLSQLFARAAGVSSQRIKISGKVAPDMYYKLVRNNLTTSVNRARVGNIEKGTAITFEFDIKKGGHSSGKIKILGKEYDAANCNIEILTKDGQILYTKNIKGAPEGTPMQEALSIYRQQLQPDIINNSEVSVVYGDKKIDANFEKPLEYFDGQQENYVFAVPYELRNKIVVRINGEVVMG